MPSLIEECLDLSETEARQQWRRVVQRQPRERQERFLPIETLLCNGLFLRLDPHAFGGGNIDHVPAEVHALAHTLKRSPGSITSKMLNLDGSRKNAARQEPELFLRLQDSGLYDRLYRLVLEAARAEGLDNNQVPDFLDALGGNQLALLGQDELGAPEIHQALQESTSERTELASAFDLNDDETSRLVEQQTRLKQHRFAHQVLENYRWTCAFCGFSAQQLPGHRLLVASHVKPWSVCTNRERLDQRNGICACPLHDSAFDTGLLTIAADLQIVRSAAITTLVPTDPMVDRYFGPATIRPKLMVPDGAEVPLDSYLAYHRTDIFRG